MTRLVVEFRIRPQRVSGRGIPFEPRWMWCVQDWSHLEGEEPREQFTPRPAFWSRHLAEAFAAERVKAMIEFLQLMSSPSYTVPDTLPILGTQSMTSERAAAGQQLR